jgi:hypothetical protein
MGSGAEILMDNMLQGRPLAIDATARSASPNEPSLHCLPGRCARLCMALPFLMTSLWMARSASSAGISAVLDLGGLSFHPLGEQQLGV